MFERKCEYEDIRTLHNTSLLSIGDWIQSGCFGKTVFLSRPEADAALKGAAHKPGGEQDA